jgi:hypothetical protein
VVRARQLQQNGAVQEAFLACVIALESIFGDRDALARSLSNRLAVVAATFTEGSKFPKTTSKRYGPSSGQRLRPSFSFRRIRAIGDQVSIQSWLRKLDHFYASVAADETPPASKFKENGLVPPPMD